MSTAQRTPALAPFPWFGGKSAIAGEVWSALGNPGNYVEPFAGSLAVLLARPGAPRTETVNDKDGLLCNFWRAVQHDPDSVAAHCDWPVNENDLHARHVWLVERMDALSERVTADPDYFDAKVAGWWVWGINAWIRGGWCSGEGPWQRDGDVLRRLPHTGDAGQGVNRQLPHTGDAGQGVNRKLPHTGDAGRGVNRKLPHTGDAGQGVREWFAYLSRRLRRVRVACGDWRRVLGTGGLHHGAECAVFLDPPYVGDFGAVYRHDAGGTAREAGEWAFEHGNDPRLRIALCGHEGDYETPDGWRVLQWKRPHGHRADQAEKARERVWLSPHCLGAAQASLFDTQGAA